MNQHQSDYLDGFMDGIAAFLISEGEILGAPQCYDRRTSFYVQFKGLLYWSVLKDKVEAAGAVGKACREHLPVFPTTKDAEDLVKNDIAPHLRAGEEITYVLERALVSFLSLRMAQEGLEKGREYAGIIREWADFETLNGIVTEFNALNPERQLTQPELIDAANKIGNYLAAFLKEKL